MANIEKMFELMAVQPKVVDDPQARPLQLTRGSIEFEGIQFGYTPDREVLKDVGFSLPAGHKVAVVGASGSGKSTLVKLLFRFYDPDAGRITIDGQDIRKVTQASLRRVIGIVPQDTVLFNDTIFENVRYGNPDATEEEVQTAIRLAHLDAFIRSLPRGGETMVGERGLKLSGGEKQRVSIARTILKRPPIMVFDEATSSLDSKSEQAILQALREISRDHTSLVIAHRLSTVVDADTIMVLDGGRIVESGTHEQLLQQGGRYTALWQAQQKQDSLG
jgi:ATP-binding cassette subfamily B protein